MKDLYVVIGNDKNDYSWSCHNADDEYVFGFQEAKDLKDFIARANLQYEYKVAKLTFLD